MEGTIERAGDEESDAYFASRTRGSQLAALVSKQSAPLESRSALVVGYLKLKAQYLGRPIPRPDFWGRLPAATRALGVLEQPGASYARPRRVPAPR